MLPHKVRREGFQRSQFFQNNTVINTPDPNKTVLELRHSGVELSLSWKLRASWKTLQPRTLSVPKPGLCNVKLAWNHSIYMKTDSSSQQPVQWCDICTWCEIRSSRANLLKECTDPGSEDLRSERAHDSVGLTTFLCCARARFNPQQDVYTVHDCCMRTPCILQKCTNTPTCAQLMHAWEPLK